MAKILIVDDSETLRSQLKRDLETQSHEVLCAADGAEGLKSIEENPDIEMLICDVNMPNIDGFGMLELVQEKQLIPNTPKLILSTEATPKMKERGKELGVRAWIAKPYVTDKLIEAVKILTGKG